MSVQLLAVIVLVGVAGLYVLRSIGHAFFRTGKGGCGSGCGKCSADAPAARQRIGTIQLHQVGDNGKG